MAELDELAKDQRRALDRVAPVALELGLYLAGGTALALHLHHRQSRDIDLFSLRPAAARRGIRRDFWDLFEMFERATPTLDQALDDYRRRFGVTDSDLYHVLRALTYFDDAESEPIYPLGLTSDKWQQIKIGIAARARDAVRSRIVAAP